ncbi:H/ACA ribonucleoprotein complex non-core subunit NAF1 [Geodia barretti]|nr:H/ACA ribonucleoprotein complex non-core subunit NAF1 [Geodia barretti]
MSVVGDGLSEGKGEGNQSSSQEVATVSQLDSGDIADHLSEKSENQIEESSNAVMSQAMPDKADSLLEAFDNQKQDGNESSSWKSYAVTAHSCVAQGPYQTISDIADGLSEVSKNQKQDGNLFTESNAATIKQVQLQAQDTVCDSAGQAEPRPSLNVCSLWTCDSSRLDSTCGDSSSSTDSSDESCIMDEHSQHHEIVERGNEHAEADSFVPRTKGETLYQDLPPVECCDVQFPNDGRLLPVATVSHYTEKLLILCGLPNTPPIDEGTILWNKARTSIAKVFETFGPVRTPFYSIRINSVNDLPSLGITFGDEVYVIPAHPTLTKYVFPQELMKWRGSDASWKDDNEVPPQLQDYSDDENEKKASKRKANLRKPKNRNESSLRELRRQTGISFTEPPRLPQSASRREPVPHYPRC